MATYRLSSIVFLAIGLAAALAGLLIAGLWGATWAAPVAEWRVCPAGPPACDYASIQAAVDAASSGDVIKVAAGTYSDIHRRADVMFPTLAISQVVYITDKSLTIRGGYSPADWNSSNPQANPTVLDAKGGGRVIYIYKLSEPPIQVTLENLVMTGGDGSRMGPYHPSEDLGGGVFARHAQLTIQGCTIHGNTASTVQGGAGGGIYISHSDNSRLTGNQVHDNTAVTAAAPYVPHYGHGGGIYIWESDMLLLENNVVHHNLASAADDNAFGGGIMVKDSNTVTVRSNVIHDNQAASQRAIGWGGGMVIYQVQAVEMLSNTIRDNLAALDTADASGGGVSWNRSSGTWRGNTISRNTGTAKGIAYGGGVDFNSFSVVTFQDNTVQDNTASADGSGRGGGIAIGDSDVTATDNTILRNRAGRYGGGVYVSRKGNAQTVLADNTIRENTAGFVANAQGRGGGVALYGTDGMTLRDNEISDNVGSVDFLGYGGGLYVEGGNPRIEANQVRGNVAASSDSGYGGGVAIQNGQPTFNANVIRLNTANLSGSFTGRGGGVCIQGSQGATLTNNVIADNRAGGSTQRGDDLYAEQHEYGYAAVVDLLHNTIANNAGQGVYAKDLSTRLTLSNTIVAGHTGTGVYVVAGTVSLASTLWHNNAANTFGTVAHTLDRAGDPLFLGGGDYHIGAGSAAQDIGINAGVTADMDGDARPSGPGFDIGADERTGPAEPTRTPTPTASPTATVTMTATRRPTVTQRVYLPMVYKR